jgi:hypothetical protein
VGGTGVSEKSTATLETVLDVLSKFMARSLMGTSG